MLHSRALAYSARSPVSVSGMVVFDFSYFLEPSFSNLPSIRKKKVESENPSSKIYSSSKTFVFL